MPKAAARGPTTKQDRKKNKNSTHQSNFHSICNLEQQMDNVMILAESESRAETEDLSGTTKVSVIRSFSASISTLFPEHYQFAVQDCDTTQVPDPALFQL